VRAPAPRFGEHTRAVLAERCGVTAEELDRLELDGIIKSE
jgi:crotonobetainyl-CoA:carnitine CoA-transferase CaiB-like acyl-CoA transferase